MAISSTLPRAQRRQLERDHVQAVIKVFAELAGLGKGFQVAVGGGDQTHIDLLRLHRADAADLTFLQYAQQARLGFQWQFADFVENRVPPSAASTRPARPALAPVKAPFSWPNSSDSIRVSGMAAQFTEIIGALARREIVQCPRHQFLAGARLALDQHVGIGGATLRILLNRSCIGAQWPMMPMSPCAASLGALPLPRLG